MLKKGVGLAGSKGTPVSAFHLQTGFCAHKTQHFGHLCSSVQSFVQQCLLGAYYVPGTVQGTEDSRNKTFEIPALKELLHQWGEDRPTGSQLFLALATPAKPGWIT